MIKDKGFLNYYLTKTIYNIKRHIRKNLKLKDVVIYEIKNTIISYCFFILLVFMDYFLIDHTHLFKGLTTDNLWILSPVLTTIISLFIISLLEFIILLISYKLGFKNNKRLKKYNAFWLGLSDLHCYKIKYKILQDKSNVLIGSLFCGSCIISIILGFIFLNQWIIADYGNYNIIQRKLMGNITSWAFLLIFLTLSRISTLITMHRYYGIIEKENQILQDTKQAKI